MYGSPVAFAAGLLVSKGEQVRASVGSVGGVLRDLSLTWLLAVAADSAKSLKIGVFPYWSVLTLRSAEYKMVKRYNSLLI